MPYPRPDEREWKPGDGYPLPEIDFTNLRPLVGRWTRFCWWLSRKLGGRKVFGKQDST